MQNSNPYGKPLAPLETVEDFLRGVVSDNTDQINRCLWEARQRPELFYALLVRLAHIPPVDGSIRRAFHSAWTNQGLWIRDCFSIDPVLAPALANLLPGYDGPALRLYRGERWLNHQNGTYGFSWTSKREVGEMFARGLNCLQGEGGVLLATNAAASAILAPPNDHSRHLGEHEYIVDRRHLTEVEVVERYQ